MSPAITPGEARAIAKDAYIYGCPLVDNYRIQYPYYVDKNNAGYMAPWNDIKNIHNVYAPTETAVQTPNSNTPYSCSMPDIKATCDISRTWPLPKHEG